MTQPTDRVGDGVALIRSEYIGVHGRRVDGFLEWDEKPTHRAFPLEHAAAMVAVVEAVADNLRDTTPPEVKAALDAYLAAKGTGS